MSDKMNDTLEPGEVHPSSYSAMIYIQSIDPKEWMKHVEAISSVALSGNRIASICMGTIERLEKKEPVSDRYLLGLAWFLRDMEEMDTRDAVAKQNSFLDELTKLSQELGLYE
jgi:hypothetical protein